MSEATYVYYMRDARICFTVSTIRYVRWFAVVWGWLSLLPFRVCVFFVVHFGLFRYGFRFIVSIGVLVRAPTANMKQPKKRK